MSESQLDLSRLALDRSPINMGARRPPSRRWFSRYGLPIGILAAFIALLGASTTLQFLPSHPVTVVPVIVKRGVVQQSETALFQAAGWIEPRPTPISVPAMTAGVIEELLVVGGQFVSKGEPIARLIAIDAELVIAQAEATSAIRQGELLRAEAERDAAQVRMDHPVHLEVQVAEAQSQLAQSKTAVDRMPFLIKSAEARLQFMHHNLEGKRSAGEGVAGLLVKQAESDYAEAYAVLGDLRERAPNLKIESESLHRKVEALKSQLRLLVEERRQLEEAKAKVITATAIVNEAKVGLRQAQLGLERTTIRAPMDGRILRLISSPGSRVMGLEASTGQHSSAIVEMYDPERLQVRVDVRLEDVPMVTPGAPVRIQTAASQHVLQGRVLQATSTANIQKNTLEVKVELLRPPQTVSPEMLVTATFMAPLLETKKSSSDGAERIYAPKQLIHSTEGKSLVWIVSEDARAVRRTVSLGGSEQNGLVEVTEGLDATDKVIASGVERLATGDRVSVTGEDPNLGR